MEKNICRAKSIRLISFLLMVSMLASVACGLVSAETVSGTSVETVAADGGSGETTTTVTDGRATVTTTKSGDNYTSLTYSMTAGTAGQSDNYCISKGSSEKATADTYCGGGGYAIIYKFPLVVPDSISEVKLEATVSGKYGVYVSIDNVMWQTVEIGDQGDNATLEFDLTEQVGFLLESASSTNVFVKFEYKYVLDEDGNYIYEWSESEQADVIKLEEEDPVLHSISMKVGYNAQWTEVEGEEDGTITIDTLTKGANTADLSDDLTTITYNAIGGKDNVIDETSGARGDERYCITYGQMKDDHYLAKRAGVVYRFPLLYQKELKSISIEVEARASTTMFVSIDNSNWKQVYHNWYSNREEKISLNLTDDYRQILEGDSASSLYVRFFVDKTKTGDIEWNGAEIYSISFTVSYASVGSVESAVDANGVLRETIITSKQKKVTTTHALGVGKDDEFLVTDKLLEAAGAYTDSATRFLPSVDQWALDSTGETVYYTDWDRTVLLKYEISDPAALEEFVWTATISNRVWLQISTNNNLRAPAQYAEWDEADAVWTTVLKYDNTEVAPAPGYKLPNGKDDTGIGKQAITINFSDYFEFDSSVTTLYVRLKNSYRNTGYGGKIYGPVTSTAHYSKDKSAEFIVSGNPVDPTDMSFKSVIYGKGSISPDNWLKLQYRDTLSDTLVSRSLDSSWIDVQWYKAVDGNPKAELLGADTPITEGNYTAVVNAADGWGLRFENVPELTVTGFNISCDHSFVGHDCDENQHWLICDGCGIRVTDPTEHTRENAYYGYSEDEHWLTCECQSYDYFVEGHNWGIWDWTMMKHWRSCKDCGYEPEQTLHTYDEGVLTLAPTLTQRGEMTYTCECGYIKVQKIDKLTEEEAGALEEEEESTTAEAVSDVESETSDVGTDEGNELSKTTIIILSIICGVLVVGGVAVAVVLVLLKKRRTPKAPDPTEPADEAAVAETAVEGETVEQTVEAPESELSEADNIIKEEKVEKTSGKNKKKSKEKPEKQPKVKPEKKSKVKPKKK